MNIKQSGVQPDPSPPQHEPKRLPAPFRHAEVIYVPPGARPPLPPPTPDEPMDTPDPEELAEPESPSESLEPLEPEAPRARPDRAYHSIRCTVCRHPQRRAIETEFIHWRNPADIAVEFSLRDRSSIYRHAHALRLYSQRKRNLRFVLENLLERVDEVPVTCTAIVRAVRAYSRINDAGEWFDPPAQLVISSGGHVSALPPRSPQVRGNQSQQGRIGKPRKSLKT